MASEYVDMPIESHLTPRDEVLEGRFQGVLQAHKADDAGDRLENNPEQLLSATYPSNALRNVFDRVDDKLSGRDSQGGIQLTGPYGSGKSHGLLVLYHLFNSPEVAAEWVDEWEIPMDIPSDGRATILSTSEIDADYIWEPIFRDLGREDLLEEVGKYPTIPHIEELVEDETLAIFFDEIESWYDSFDEEEDETLIERNETFLRNLLEVSEDPQQSLFVFMTLLDRSQDLKRILNRTSPYGEPMEDTGDREKIILHRLFEESPEERDRDAIRGVVQEYVDSYEYPIEIDEPKRFENEMVDTYPFHPTLLDLLDSIYEAAAERQNVRGAMNVLADAVREKYGETDLLITCDVNPRAFRGINRELYNRYTSDKNVIEDIEFGDDLLQVILLYTLDDRSQRATVTNTLLGSYKPSKTTVDRLHMSLESLYGTAHYLDKQDDSYHITEDPRLTALVEREKEQVLDGNREDVVAKLAEIVRDELFDGDVYVFPEDDVPDAVGLSFVVMLEMLSNGNLESKLEGFYDGRSYQNMVQFITPKQKVRGDNDIIKKTARVLGAENLRGKVDDENDELEPLIRDERRELRTELEGRYGKWVKWSDAGGGDVRMRRVNVAPSTDDVEQQIGSDKTYVGEHILEEVEDAENGVRVGSLLTNFKQFRRLPVLIDDETFYGAVSKLHRDEKIVLEGDRAKFYVADKGEFPSKISDDLTIHHPNNLPDSVFEEEKEDEEDGENGKGVKTDIGDRQTTVTGTAGEGGTTTTSGGTTSTKGGEDPPTGTTTTTEEIEIEFAGNSPSVLASSARSRVSDKGDTVSEVTLTYNVDGYSKDELLKMLEDLPDGNHIDVEVVIQREREE